MTDQPKPSKSKPLSDGLYRRLVDNVGSGLRVVDRSEGVGEIIRFGGGRKGGKSV